MLDRERVNLEVQARIMTIVETETKKLAERFPQPVGLVAWLIVNKILLPEPVFSFEPHHVSVEHQNSSCKKRFLKGPSSSIVCGPVYSGGRRKLANCILCASSTHGSIFGSVA